MLKWSSLEDWGSGNVRVALDYVARRGDGATAGGYSTSQSFSAAESMTGATRSWTVGSLGDPWWAMDGLSSVSRIRVYKVVDGVEVLVSDSTGDLLQTATLSWQKSPVEGTQVDLYYRAANPAQPSAQWNTSDGSWTKLSTGTGIETRGSRYWVDLGSVPAGQYNYVLVYKRPGETQAYAQGTGTFAVASTTAVGATQIAGFVEEPGLDLVSTGSASFGTSLTTNWEGSNSVTLKWSSLRDWGSGNVRVALDYVARRGDGATAGGYSTSQTFSATDAMTGATLSWTVGSPGDPWWAMDGLSSVSRIRVYKVVDGVEVLLHDSSVGDRIQPERLILRGNTAGLSAVEVRDEQGSLLGTRATALLGNGVYAVDVSDLARGRYTFTPVVNGTAAAYRQGFEVRGSVAVGKPVIQEHGTYVDLVGTGSASYGTSLTTDWEGSNCVTLRWTVGSPWDPWWAMDGLSSVSLIRVYKVVDGVEVLMADSTCDAYTPRLELSNLPAAASIVTLEYRKAGSTDPFLLKSTTQIGTGWFSASYDDVPVGAYEYRLTVRDAANNPLDLTSVGGNAQGQISGSIEIRRGGQDLPDSPGNVVTVAKTIASYNAFGEVTA